MAKQRTSFFERHVEKGVVVVTAILLIGVMVTYVFDSPNKINMKGQDVGPGEVDGQLRTVAESVLSAMGSNRAEALDMDDYPSEQTEGVGGPITQSLVQPQLRASVPFGVPVPAVVGPGVRGELKLAQLVAPDQPQVKAGRFSAYLPVAAAPVGEDVTDLEHQKMLANGPVDTSWVTIAARLDVPKQEQEFLKKDYQTDHFGVRLSKASVQRQRRLADGDWSDWEDIDPYALNYFEPVPQMDLLEDDNGEPIIPLEQRRGFVDWLAELDEYSNEVLRPKLPEKWDGEDWSPPMCRAIRELYPDEQFTCPAPQVIDESQARNPRQRAKAELEAARRLFAEGELDAANELAAGVVTTQAYPRAIRVEAQSLQEEIIKALEQRDVARQEAEENAEEGETPRRDAEIALVHDLSANPGQSYRYRVRLHAVNEYAMKLDRVSDPVDAARAFLVGEWSKASEPVYVPPLQRAFVVGVKNEPGKMEAKFDLVRWTQGEWVKTNARVRLGEAIGGPAKVQHQGQNKRIEVDFSTGLTLVSINEDTLYVPARHERDGTITIGDAETSPSVLVMDPNREMYEFFLAAHKADPERKTIQDEMNRSRRRTGRKRGG
jgi:hypothetical protein